MKLTATVFIGLGTNQGDRLEILRGALSALEKMVGKLMSCSSFYESEAVGFVSEHLFINAVASLETVLGPQEVLAALHAIEAGAGRYRPEGRRYADRTLDLDLLYFSDLQIDTPDLQVPHPRIAERRFVLQPLAEIAPGWIDPKRVMNIAEMLAGCGDPSVLAVYPKSVK